MCKMSMFVISRGEGVKLGYNCVHFYFFQNDEDANSEITEDVVSESSENNEANSCLVEEATDTEVRL